MKKTMKEPPVAKKIKKINRYNENELIDNYFWLREKENPEVTEYLNEENSYTKSFLEHTEPLQKEIYNELVKRTKEDDESVPEKIDDWYYYRRIEKGKNYKIYCRKKNSLEASEEIILDVNQLAIGKDYVSIGNVKRSPNHKYLAYTVDFTGYEKYLLYIKDLESLEINEIQIEDLASPVIWGNDSKSIFYQKLDEIHNPNKVFSHENIHSFEQYKEKLILDEKRSTKYVSMYKTKDSKFLFVNSDSIDSSEAFFLSLDGGSKELIQLKKEVKDVLYYPSHNKGFFYIITNENAINFKILRVKVEEYNDINKWEVFLDHDQNVYIYDIEMFQNHMVLSVRKNGLKNIQIYSISSKNWHDVEFEEPLYSINENVVPSNPDYNTSTLRFEFSSMSIPSTIIDYNMDTKVKDIKKVEEVYNYNQDDFLIEREFARADDGTKIPISVIYGKKLKKDGNNKLLLYGYGSYGYSMDPSFVSGIISLLERDFVYAIAHIRGGAEQGRQWYLDGKYLKKKNTFTDFIACAEHLIKSGYTNSSKLGIRGGSAGGLLIGAVLNFKPELIKVAILDVPFVDVINTMMDESIPLTTLEYEEWGNPNDKVYYNYMKSYSPYDNLKAEGNDFKYPHILVTAGLNDPRVHYWEPSKYVAKLRTLKNKEGNRLLYKINMGAGHKGLSGKYQYLKEAALRYAFLIDSLNN